MKKEFEFKANGGFYIWSRGFSFYGDIKCGEIKKGAIVEVIRDFDKITAKIGLIAIDGGKLIESTKGYKDVSLLLTEFSDHKLNTIEQRFNPDGDNEPPFPKLFGATFPIYIQNAEL